MNQIIIAIDTIFVSVIVCEQSGGLISTACCSSNQ